MPRHLVMIAFGPARVTRRAVDRARALLDPADLMTIVPAWDHARRGLGSLRSPFIAVSDDAGSTALRAVLEEATGRVLRARRRRTQPGGLAALELAHAPPAPWRSPTATSSTPPGTSGHFLKHALRLARSSVTVTSTSPTRPAQQFRTSCVLGRQEQVRRLVSARLTDPRAMVRRWTEPVVVAEGAVAAHDSIVRRPVPRGCRPRRTAAARGNADRPGRGGHARRLPGEPGRPRGPRGRRRHRLRGRTVAVAQERGAEVFEVPWTGDFAAARNAVLDRCRDAWFVLQVDADERVVCDDPEMVRRRLAADAGDAPLFRVRIDNVIGGEIPHVVRRTAHVRAPGHDLPRRTARDADAGRRRLHVLGDVRGPAPRPPRLRPRGGGGPRQEDPKRRDRTPRRTRHHRHRPRP